MKILLSIVYLFFNFVLFSQLLPNITEDNGWVLDPNLTDEFNYTGTYDPSKWTWNPGYTQTDDASCMKNDINHIYVDNGYVRLSYRELSSTCLDGTTPVSKDYSSGNLYGLNERQYGYFEARVRVSDPPASPANHDGLAANVWLWRSTAPYNGIWSEIDLAEIDCSDYRHTCNVIFDPNEDDGIPSQENMRCPVSGATCYPPDFNLSPSWHTYSAIWNANGIAIYVDGHFVNHTKLGCPGMEPLNWILDPNSGEYQFSLPITSSTELPFFMDIDYVRVYKLNSTKCANTINTCTFNFSTHDDLLRKSITIGGGCANTMPTSGLGAKVYLRATDYVEIQGDFEVPIGAELIIETTEECHI